MRRTARRVSFLLALAAIGSAAFAADQQASCRIAPAPSWVTPVGAPAARGQSEPADESLSYLLVDDQVNVATMQRFSHIVTQVRTADGVQDGSTVTIDFDPSFEKLTLHTLTVSRNGVTSSRLSRDDIQILHREPDLESFVLDGSLTASIVLKDVRVGDVIDYAYSIQGRNPAFGGLYVGEFSCGWRVAVAREQIRVLAPGSRAISYKMHGTSAEPVRSSANGTTTLVWSFADLAAIASEDQTPGWYVDTPWVELSEFGAWRDVRQWAQALYPPARLTPELTALTQQWMKQWTDAERRARAALDYVQQNVRYLGIELGTGSYAPRAPAEVLAKRFGDCKDQAYLLLTLLQGMGIAASPVLVSSYAKDLVAQRLPSPTDFDHVIVHADIDGRSAFLDPTRMYQRGSVFARYVPDYGYGLVVAEKDEGLHRFGAAQGVTADLDVHEAFAVGGRDEPAHLDVTTTARGDAADRLRSFFASRRRDEVSREYLDFYAERYPSVQTAKALSVDDDAENDVFRTFEHYSITGFWKPGSTEGASVAELYPDLVRSEIPAPRSKSRTKPLEVEYPRHVLQYISVDLPEAWKIKAEDTTETTDAFALSTKISCIGSSLSLAYDYSARAAEVAPDKMAKYNLDVQRIKDDLGYQLTLGGPRETAASGTTDSSFALIGTGVLAVLVVGGGVAISRAMARRRATAGIAMPLAGSQPFGLPAIGPTGLGGWLVLVGLAVIAQSVVSALNLARIVPLFSPGSWHDLAVPGGARYHPLWAPMLFLEAFDAIGMGLAGIYLAVLFFERRASFPNLFIWVRAAGAALVLADSMLGLWLPETANDWQARFNQIAQAVTSCAIWIPYMLRSRRVKNTFTR